MAFSYIGRVAALGQTAIVILLLLVLLYIFIVLPILNTHTYHKEHPNGEERD